MPDVFNRNKHSSRNSVALGFYLLGICLVLAGCATSTPVIKMPKVLPDIIKQYKTTTVYGNRSGMYSSRVHVKEVDLVTFIAKGEISYWPRMGRINGSSTPDHRLLYLLGEEPRFYNGYYRESVFRASLPFLLSETTGGITRYFPRVVIVVKGEYEIISFYCRV